MKSVPLRIWSGWLRRHPAKRFGATVTLTATACCAAAAPIAHAAGDDATLSQSTTGMKVHDTTLTAKAKAALLGASDLTSGDVHVKTRHGHVTLTGSVPDTRQRTLAVDTVKQVDGVQGVRDQLTIRPK